MNIFSHYSIYRLKRATLLITTIVCFATMCNSFSVKAKASEKEKVLQTCSQLFGESVDERLNLFEINRFYVLRVEFGKRDKLVQLAVEPKYYFDDTHEDWKEPGDFTYLSKIEYKNLVGRLETIKPKGALVKPALNISIVTNMTAWHTEIYENASLTWGQLVDLRSGDGAPYEIRWFHLNYGKEPVRE